MADPSTTGNTCTDPDPETDPNTDGSSSSDGEGRVAILDAFSIASIESIDAALANLNVNPQTTPQDRLQHLLRLQRHWNQIMEARITETRGELRDLNIAQSPLLSQSPAIWRRIALYLDEPSLYCLERLTNPVYATCARRQRPCWDPQWRFLDQTRHSKSCIQNDNPRIRGLQFAKASLIAQKWENQVVRSISEYENENEEPLLQLTHEQLQEDRLIYNRDDFVEDFGYFFQDPTQAGAPTVEFFLRLCYTDDKTKKKQVLLEGFQSNYISLRHTQNAQDTGYHTYIGAGGDRLQVVMVRNDLHLLRDRMGLDEYYNGMDSDDSELESDEEEEFHFLQWPEASRRQFLDNLTITILRYDCGPDKSGSHHQANNSNSDPPIQPRVVGSTRGYYESDQHFAMFCPLTTAPDASNDGEQIMPPVVRIGLGCGGGDSLHLVIKWVNSPRMEPSIEAIEDLL